MADCLLANPYSIIIVLRLRGLFAVVGWADKPSICGKLLGFRQVYALAIQDFHDAKNCIIAIYATL